MSNHEFVTLVSDEFPPDLFPFIRDDSDPLFERAKLADFAYDITQVEKLGDLGDLTVTPETRYVAFLLRNPDTETYVQQGSRYGIVASIAWDGIDSLLYVTPDGVAYEVEGGDMPECIPPEAIGLEPYPFWERAPIWRLGSFWDD